VGERILAVDPGKMTGWVFYEIGRPKSFTGDEAPQLEFLDMVWRVLPKDRLDTIVVEDFIISPRTAKLTRGDWSLEQIGTLRWMAHQWDVKFDDSQTPRAAKPFAPDTMLKRVGWFVRTAGGHRNDAARHMLLYLARTGRLEDVLVRSDVGEDH